MPLRKVQRAAVKMMEPLDSSSLYEVCTKQALKLSGADYGSLFLEKNGKLRRKYSNLPLKYRLKPRKNGYTYTAFKEGKIKSINMHTIGRIHPNADKKFGSTIFIPLVYQRKRIGVISLDSVKEKKYSIETKNMLKLFGTLTALAIRNIELYESSQLALQTRELFMSTAAHEIKTPIAVIQAYSELMKKRLSNGESVEAKWVEAIYANNKKLQRLINDLFSVSQMRMGIFKYRFVMKNIATLASKVAADLSVSSKREIIFANKIEGEALARIDSEKMELALNNVISNAVKYSPEGTRIKIILKKDKGNCYIISVIDTGKGIPKKDLPHVFDKFYQGHDISKGMGLGLFLCKEIVEAHDGEIKITSKVNGGTKVNIYLPQG